MFCGCGGIGRHKGLKIPRTYHPCRFKSGHPHFYSVTQEKVSCAAVFISAGMAELADAPDLGSGVQDVQVQVLLPALRNVVLS